MSNSPNGRNLKLGNIYLSSISVTIIFGFIEWLLIGKMGIGLRQGESCRIIFAIVTLYSIFGIVFGLASSIFLRKSNIFEAAIFLPIGILTMLYVIARSHHKILFAAVLALGWVLVIVLRHIGLRYPDLPPLFVPLLKLVNEPYQYALSSI